MIPTIKSRHAQIKRQTDQNHTVLYNVSWSTKLFKNQKKVKLYNIFVPQLYDGKHFDCEYLENG